MNTIQKSIGYSIWIILLFTLAGCGFKLRGSETLPPPLRQFFLQTHRVEAAFTRDLTTALKNRGVTLTASPQQAPFTLLISNTRIDQTITSTSSDMLVRNYLITYSLSYQLLWNNGQRLTPPQTIAITRSFVTNTTQILNDSYEFSTLRQDLRQEAMSQLFDRLRVVKI